MAENNGTEREETPEEHRAFVDKVAGVLASKGFKVETRVPVPEPADEKHAVIPIRQARRGEYGCDSCSATDVPRFYLVRIRPKVDHMLCPGCKDARDKRKDPAPVVAVYEVTSATPVLPSLPEIQGMLAGHLREMAKMPCPSCLGRVGTLPCQTCHGKGFIEPTLKQPIDVTAIVNKPAGQRKAEIKSFLDGVIGDFEKRAEPIAGLEQQLAANAKLARARAAWAKLVTEIEIDNDDPRFDAKLHSIYEEAKAEMDEALRETDVASAGTIAPASLPGAPVKHFFNSFNGDAVQALMPRRPILLNTGVSLTFELVSVDIAACTLHMVSEACDIIENRPAWSKITIIPPVEGTSRFEVTVNEDKVSIDLPALKRELVEALEAMI